MPNLFFWHRETGLHGPRDAFAALLAEHFRVAPPSVAATEKRGCYKDSQLPKPIQMSTVLNNLALFSFFHKKPACN